MHSINFPHRTWLNAEECRIEDLEALLDDSTSKKDVPLATTIEKNVPGYDVATVESAYSNSNALRELGDEWARTLRSGAGIFIIKGAFSRQVIDASNEVLEALLAEQRENKVNNGDHFAPPGTNERLWGAQEKFAFRSAETYVDYYNNPTLALACAAWLGPMYQVTSDLNVVLPGGKAQTAHRDYHLGFMEQRQAERFPSHVHALSACLTLQGAIAHCDMPLESGPTQYLPFSQRYLEGYLAIQREDVRQLFQDRYIQLPLDKGDAVFFNPALFHCAGSNTSSDIRRMANLIQVSSGFGRAMGNLDRMAICRAIYPTLAERASRHGSESVAHAIAASAEGYPFPTNLSKDQPINSLVPETQAELITHALDKRLSTEDFITKLQEQFNRRQPGD